MKRMRFKLNPYLKIVLGFLAVILLGAILLYLPISTTNGNRLSFVDALFTSVSAVCVTGLAVAETGVALTFFGQVVLLLLIQVGGLGFMTVAALVFLLLGKRIGLYDRLALQESLNQFDLEGVVQMTKRAIQLTFSIESIGALIMLWPMTRRYGFLQGLWASIFQAVSAFCNAGFDIFGNGNSMASFVGDPVVMITTMLLIVFGGLGFLVILDVSKHVRKKTRLRVQSRLVLTMTAGLIVFGGIFFTLVEWNNPNTLGGLPAWQKPISGFFQSVTARTAGYASFPQDAMQSVSSIMTMLLMYIGASPAGTGGGIKTTTFAIIILLMVQIIKGRTETVVYNHSVNRAIVLKAIGVAALSLVLIIISTIVVCLIEGTKFTGTQIAFEVVSAFATVGLSQAVTPLLSVASKVIIMLMMFGGRVGLLSLVMALSRQFAKNKGNITYPEEKVMIG